jgi:hypothetical protein
MARPCGCAGECGCTIVGVNGISATGTGSTRDPKVIGLASPINGVGCNSIMDCVGSNAGPGLRYIPADHDLAIRLSNDADNQAELGSDLGIYVNGAGGGGEGGGTTVESLPETIFVGGQYGGGWMQYPEGTKYSYEGGMAYELPLIHVPVRRSSDSYAIAIHHRVGTTYNSAWPAAWDTIELNALENIDIKPNGAGTDGDPGYFGGGMRNQVGITKLADVFNIVGDKSVMYLQCLDVGGVGETTDPVKTLTSIRQTVLKHNSTKRVIVGAEIRSGDAANVNAFMASLNGLGIATAVHLPTTTATNAAVGVTIAAAGYTWVTVDIGAVVPAKITEFIAAGLNVLYTGCGRQLHFDGAVTAGIRGVIATTPIYCGGKLNTFQYRNTIASWNFGAADHGRFAYGTNLPEFATDRWRGYVRPGIPGIINIDGNKVPPGEDPGFIETGLWILMGEQCPVRDNTVAITEYGAPSNYDIEFGVSWSAVLSDTARWAGVFLACPTDPVIRDWSQATTDTRGYLFTLSQNGTFEMARYDGVAFPPGGDPTVTPPYAFGNTWASGFGVVSANTEYRMKVQVRPTQITFSRADGGGSFVYVNTTWRGPYFYLGRHFFNTVDTARVGFHTLTTVVY